MRDFVSGRAVLSLLVVGVTYLCNTSGGGAPLMQEGKAEAVSTDAKWLSPNTKRTVPVRTVRLRPLKPGSIACVI
jgi:hypothetical protein